MQSCASCRYCSPRKDTTPPSGTCRRNPPIEKMLPDGKAFSGFIQVGLAMWCGHYKRRTWWSRWFGPAR